MSLIKAEINKIISDPSCSGITNKNISINAAANYKESDSKKSFPINLLAIENLLLIMFSIFLSSLAYGILMVMIAIRLDANVKNDFFVSLSTITQIGAGIIFSRFLPHFVAKRGMVSIICFASLAAALCSLLLYRYFGYALWLLTIYILGTSLFSMGVSRDTLMINCAPQKMRAIVISLGSGMVAFGCAMGPIIINLLKTGDEFSSFVIACILYIISILPLLRLSKSEPKIRQNKKISPWRYISNSPKIMFGGFCSSYAMSSCTTFAIIYGIHSQITKEGASLLLSSFLLGTIFYLPIGFLCNRLNRRFIMIVGDVLALICIWQICFGEIKNQIFLLFFLLFGGISAIKLPSILLINEKYKATQRLAVNAAYSKVCLFGTIFGVTITGLLMQIIGHLGLWISVSAMLLLFLIFCLYNAGKKLKRGIRFNRYFFLLKPYNRNKLKDA